MLGRIIIVAAAIVLLVLLAACGETEPTATVIVSPTPTLISTPTLRQAQDKAATATLTPTATPTATATSIPTSTPTATSTPTPSPTPTPTPTAIPVAVSDDLREARLSAPVPQGGAPCGVVDLLDFPLDPPDGLRVVFGGQDFGVLRNRFNGYHAGEDWWNGSASFGTPVHSIGHGTVTFAEPWGWGADKGVVIVRHVFSDGRAILSFYGHLDPPSVVLSAGECVERGEQIARIGRPRTRPHLHFEIRSHMPAQPGPGYWPSDPSLAGWEPPSQYIWDYRITTSPGVLWTRSYADWGTRALGALSDDTFAVVEDATLMGINLLDGSLSWERSNLNRVYNAMLDARRERLYVSNRYGRVEAFRIVDSQDEVSFAPLWQIKLDIVGVPALMPLPGGGVAVSSRGRVFAVSAAGALLWERDDVGRPFDWALVGEQLIFSTTGGEDASLWAVDESGPRAQSAQVNGRPVVVGDQFWVYSEEGVYRLDPETLAAELLYALPKAILWWGDMLALPDGGVLVAHADAFDRRLIALDADGALRWQRSYKAIVRGQQQLLLLDGRVHMVLEHDSSRSSEVSVFAIDVDSAELARIFTGGTRQPQPDDTWAFALDDGRMLINVGGGNMVALDPGVALEALLQE